MNVLKGFIIKVSGVILAFCVISWFFSHFSFKFEYVTADESMLAALSRVLAFAFKPMGVDDWRIAYSALCGFVAKENVAATVAMLMTFRSLFFKRRARQKPPCGKTQSVKSFK